jgi:hypothetical protein
MPLEEGWITSAVHQPAGAACRQLLDNFPALTNTTLTNIFFLQ